MPQKSSFTMSYIIFPPGHNRGTSETEPETGEPGGAGAPRRGNGGTDQGDTTGDIPKAINGILDGKIKFYKGLEWIYFRRSRDIPRGHQRGQPAEE